MLIRHGTRFAGRDEVDAMKRTLPHLQRAIFETSSASKRNK